MQDTHYLDRSLPQTIKPQQEGGDSAELKKASSWNMHRVTRFDRLKKWALRSWRVCALGSVLPLISAVPALSADRVVFDYGPLEFAVSVDSLETYAESGETTGNLALFARFVERQERDQLREMLREPLPLTATEVSQVFYSSFGETSLQRLGEVVQTDARKNGFYALRSSIILAAAEPEGLTLLNVVKQFPTSTIRIKADRAMQVVNEFTRLTEQTERITAFLAQQAVTEAATEQPVNYIDRLNLQQPGVATWSQKTVELNDRIRRRRFAVDLYLPDLQRNAPTVIISHGIAADRDDFSELAKHLASYGLAVAVLDHPGSGRQQFQNLMRGLAQEMTEPNEFINRPLDVSYLLNELEKLDRSDKDFHGRMNLQKVGVIGHSLGGYTALALAGAEFNSGLLERECQPNQTDLNVANLSMLLQCQALNATMRSPHLRDDRIQAVVAVNPSSNSIFGQEGLQRVQTPVMFIGGSNDRVAPVLLEQVCPFTWLTVPDRYLAVIDKGTHVYGSQEADELMFPGETVNPNPALAQSYLRALSLAFTKVYVADQPEYRDYLRSSYAQSISESPLQLTMVNTVSAMPLSQTLAGSCPGIYLSQD